MKRKMTGVIATMAMAMTAPAAAQTLDPRCEAALAGPAWVFDDAGHRKWYVRFWTGRCSGLIGCWGGPHWSQVVDRAAAEGDPAVMTRACRLGRRLGHEWARDNDLRRVNNDDLRRYNDQLRSSAPFRASLAAVARDVDARLAGR